MSSPEDIEIAKQARAVEISREDKSVGALALTDDNYGVQSEINYTEPMVVEGQVPYSGPADPWNQDYVDSVVSDVQGPEQEPYYGPMSRDPVAYDAPEVMPSFGVDSYNPITDYFEPDRLENVSTTDGLGLDDLGGAGESFLSSRGTAYESPRPYARGLLDPDNEELTPEEIKDRKRSAAKAIAINDLSKDVFDAMTPEEQEIEIQAIDPQEITEGVGEDIEVTTPAGAVVPEPAQTMESKNPYAALQKTQEQARQVKLDHMDTQIEAIDRLQARELVRSSEDASSRDTKVKESDASFDELKSAMKDLGDLKIDRGRYWNSKTTGMKIAAAISLMVSAYAHAKSGRGGIDPALKMMMKAVEDDVSDQVMEYNSKKQGVGRKQNLYGLFRQRLGDHDRAEKATRMKMMGDLRMEIMKSEAKTKSQVARLAMQEAQQKIKLQEQGLLSKYSNLTPSQQLNREKFDYRKQEDLGKRETSVIGKDGKPLYAKSPSQAIKVDKINSESNVALNQYNLMSDLLDKHDAWDFINPLSSVENEIRDQRATMIGSFRGMITPGGGPLTDEDRRQIDKVNRDTTNLFSFHNISDVMGATKLAQESLDSFRRYTIMRRDEEIRTMVRGAPASPALQKRKRIIPGPKPK